MPAVRAVRRAERANIVPSTQQKTKETSRGKKCVGAMEGRIDVDNDLRDVGPAWHFWLARFALHFIGCERSLMTQQHSGGRSALYTLSHEKSLSHLHLI